MGSKDLADGSVSCRSDKGKGVGKRLKGLFGSLRRPQDETTLDDVRFERHDEPATGVIERSEAYAPQGPETDVPPENHTAAYGLDDIADECEDTQVQIETGIPETDPAGMRDAHYAYADTTAMAEGPTETTAVSEDVRQGMTESVAYCDFLPPMGHSVRRIPGTRKAAERRTAFIAPLNVYDADEPVSGFNSSAAIGTGDADVKGTGTRTPVFDPDEPVSGLAAGPAVAGTAPQTSRTVNVTFEHAVVTEQGMSDVYVIDRTVNVIIDIDGPADAATGYGTGAAYIPNFIMVDGAGCDDPEVTSETGETLCDVLPDEVLRMFDDEDSMGSPALDISVYDEQEDEYVTVEVEGASKGPGVNFDFFSPPSGGGSVLSFTWGHSGQSTRAEREGIALRPMQSGPFI